MGIGYRIKEARERLGLTQTELGQKVGVTGSAITNYEKETSHPKVNGNSWCGCKLPIPRLYAHSSKG